MLSNVVESLIILNEAGLLWHCEDRVKLFHSTVIPVVQKIFAKALLNVHVNVNFIVFNEDEMGPWIAQQETDGVFKSKPRILVDYHNYYNFGGYRFIVLPDMIFIIFHFFTIYFLFDSYLDHSMFTYSTTFYFIA